MASRSKYAFIMPIEFLDLLDELRVSTRLQVVLHRGRLLPRELWNGDRDAVLKATRVFLGGEEAIDAEALADDASPARLGWVMVDVPIVDGAQLFASQIAARSDWFDKGAGQIRENKEALKRFDKVWKVLAPRLRFPVRARHVLSGAESSYSNIGYSAGAADWFRDGGRLRQQGVANIEFLIPDAASA